MPEGESERETWQLATYTARSDFGCNGRDEGKFLLISNLVTVPIAFRRGTSELQLLEFQLPLKRFVLVTSFQFPKLE